MALEDPHQCYKFYLTIWGDFVMKEKKTIIAVLAWLIISLIASGASASEKKFNTAKVRDLFSQNGNGDWTFTLTSNSSDCFTGLSIQLSPQGDGSFQTGIYGYFYSKSDKAFLKTTGYTFNIDGHKYSFQDSPVTVSLSTNLGKAECSYVVHPLLNKMIKELKNAKEVEVGIGFETRGISGISVVQTYSGNDIELKTLKSMANALISANYFDNVSQEYSVFQDLITATESYE